MGIILFINIAKLNMDLKQIETALSGEYRPLMLGAINSEKQIIDSRILDLMMNEQHKRLFEYAENKKINSKTKFLLASFLYV